MGEAMMRSQRASRQGSVHAFEDADARPILITAVKPATLFSTMPSTMIEFIDWLHELIVKVSWCYLGEADRTAIGGYNGSNARKRTRMNLLHGTFRMIRASHHGADPL
eukprot:TRINITY_DN6100_c1_g10_i1.p1 TRINITY_DN6100_c1_g10~~TRINITY_DN6100_c1_g10_i1.p1  ORF type:complete len:108 (+),score=6.49 TRINITY_DN6100_c1_g10_i1:42-365(+)